MDAKLGGVGSLCGLGGCFDKESVICYRIGRCWIQVVFDGDLPGVEMTIHTNLRILSLCTVSTVSSLHYCAV